MLFVGNNSDIGKEGWAAVGRALSSKKNLKKFDLSEFRGRVSSTDPDRHSA
jgi:hypothetical protein